ncbi:MaoC family dehydratase [Acrocarpospora macrocephala]|uniref:(R)-hydratase n=1 Tax=Acrocarpospora macrocephala TaxID=150177 RepID=A0A5M3WRM1_9ACTN|nr:MaoC family dehydratase [Acrocarpospora macrocephala]GES09393.1 (R)-hydratase [Acrocarpospora macrocephala]
MAVTADTTTNESEAETVIEGTSREITQDLMVEYTDTLGFRNPIHYSGDFAGKSEYGGPIASGPFALALVDDLLLRHFPRSWLTSGALSVAYLAPVRPGATITGRVEVTGLAKSAPGSRVQLAVSCVTGEGTVVMAGTASVDVL